MPPSLARPWSEMNTVCNLQWHDHKWWRTIRGPILPNRLQYSSRGWRCPIPLWMGTNELRQWQLSPFCGSMEPVLAISPVRHRTNLVSIFSRSFSIKKRRTSWRTGCVNTWYLGHDDSTDRRLLMLELKPTSNGGFI